MFDDHRMTFNMEKGEFSCAKEDGDFCGLCSKPGVCYFGVC